jgi:hypothetical protein
MAKRLITILALLTAMMAFPNSVSSTEIGPGYGGPRAPGNSQQKQKRNYFRNQHIINAFNKVGTKINPGKPWDYMSGWGSLDRLIANGRDDIFMSWWYKPLPSEVREYLSETHPDLMIRDFIGGDMGV